MPGPRKRRPLRPFIWLSLLAALVLAGGCSTANTTNGDASNVNHLDASGNSVPGWVVLPTGGSHATSATLNYVGSSGIGVCAECHGSDLSGGISNVSCYQNPAGCHHGPVSGWVATPPGTQEHGVSAKKAPGSSGFASCQICHAYNFSGGGSNVSCFSASPCHGVNAPHAPKPWRTSPYTHTDTDPSNASICAQCHYPNSPNNPANHPATPAPTGTPPGCFNSTLCHGEPAAPHPVDNTWVTTPPAPEPHGIDAKAAPGNATGFVYCQDCHGAGQNFDGGVSGVSCTNTAGCHGAGVFSPHPPDWLPGDTYVHTTTDQGNANVCAYCHSNGDNSPIPAPSPTPPAGTPAGCFNGTLCHASVAPHPLDNTWVTSPPAPEPHGNDAKGTPGPGATTGFTYCQECHGSGTNFSGGSSGVSCTNTAGCHGVAVASPHPSAWLTGDTYVHTTTDQGNADVCAYCHQSSAGTPGCFNGTLCHAAPVPHPVDNTWVTTPPAPEPHGNQAKGAPGAGTTSGFAYCQECHGSGTNFSGGISGVSCTNTAGCHGAGVASPHPSAWLPGDTYVHTTTNAGNASVCAYCHQSSAGTPGCFNNTLCH